MEKNEYVIDPDELRKIIDEVKQCYLPFHDCKAVTVVKTMSGRKYIDSSEENLKKILSQQSDFMVLYALCIAENGYLDIPSYDFRQFIYQARMENRKSIIVLQGENGFLLRELYITL